MIGVAMRRVTINDVAEKARVSKATVSHVVNHTRFVEEKTQQRVLQVIEELGYQPSLVARSLTTNQTRTIGFIVSDATNIFFGDILRGIEDILHSENYSIIVCNTDEILEREDHYLNLMLGQRVDGIIAAATSQKWEVLSKAEAFHIPIILVDRYYEGLDFPFIGVDNQAGAFMGTQCLIRFGYTRVGILAGFQRLSTMRERLAGFKQAMNEAGIEIHPEWIIESPLTIEAGLDAARAVLSLPNRPNALFMNNNLLSLGTLMAIKELGLSCPDDIALVGFDDHPWSAISNPPLTVVCQPSRRVGQLAAKTLLDLIMKGIQPDHLKTQLACELVIRESCCQV
jgi:LacI family transcriptional regulator